MDEYPDLESLLLEEFVDGPEVAIDTVIQNGRVVWAGVTIKRLRDDPFHPFVEMPHALIPHPTAVLLVAVRTNEDVPRGLSA